MEIESAHSQENQFSFSTVLDSRGMAIVPVNEEITRRFEDYLEDEIFHDNPDAQPNNSILTSANDGEEIQSQPPRVMYGTSLITQIEAQWIFQDVERPSERLLQQPFFGAYSFQIKLEEKYFQKIEKSTLKIKKRKRTREEINMNTSVESINSTSMALIYSYSIRNGLSRNGVENLLEMVDNVTRLEFNKTVNKIQWKAIRSNFDKIHSNVFSPI